VRGRRSRGRKETGEEEGAVGERRRERKKEAGEK
jgi:hypothetical protein